MHRSADVQVNCNTMDGNMFISVVVNAQILQKKDSSFF